MEPTSILKSTSTVSEGRVTFRMDHRPVIPELDGIPEPPPPPSPTMENFVLNERTHKVFREDSNEDLDDPNEMPGLNTSVSMAPSAPPSPPTVHGRRGSISSVFTKKRSGLKKKSNSDLKKRSLRSEMSKFFAKQNVDREKFELKDLAASLGVKVSKHDADKQHNIRKAACYLTDAFHGRLQNGLGSTFEQPVYVRYAFRVHMTDFYRYLLRISSIVLMIMIFFEPSSFANRDDHNDTATMATLGMELVLVVILSTDMILRVLYMGYSAIAKKYFLRLHVYLLVIALVDVVVALVMKGGSFRVSRVFRPMLFVLLDKSTLQLARQCINAERKLRVLAALLVFTVCVFSLLISSFCSNAAWIKGHDEQVLASGLTSGWGHDWRPFQDFARGLTPLLSLVTVEGYHDNVLPWTEQFPELVIVFYSMIVACTYVLLNLAVAIQVDEFQRLHTKSTTNEEAKLMKTLTVVFYLARDEESHLLSFESFRNLMHCWRPNMKITLINGLFQSVAARATDLDLEQFLEVCDGLRSAEANSAKHYETRGVVQHTKRIVTRAIETVRSSRIVSERWFLSSEMEMALHNLINKPAVVHLFGFVVCCNFVLFAIASDDNASRYTDLVPMLDLICLGVFAFETLFGIWVDSWRVYWTKRWNRYQLSCVVFCAIVYAFHPLLIMYFRDRLLMRNPALSVHKIAFVPRAFRLLKGLNRFEEYVGLILKVLPVLKDFAKLIVCFMYAHAVVCMEVLWEARFYATAKNALLSQLMLLQMDGWQNTVYSMFDEVNNVSQYFGVVLICGFIWYFTIIILSQLMATMYDIFKVHKAQELADATNVAKSGRAMGLDLRKGKTPWRFYALGDAGKEIKRKLVHQVRRASETTLPSEGKFGIGSPTPPTLPSLPTSSSTTMMKSYSLAAAVATFPESPRMDSPLGLPETLPNIAESPREMPRVSSRVLRQFSSESGKNPN